MSASATLAGLSPQQLDVLDAVALGGRFRTRNWVLEMLACMEAKNAQGKRYTGDEVKDLIKSLAEAHCLVEDRYRPGYWEVSREVFSTIYLGLIDSGNLPALHSALARAMHFNEGVRGAYFRDVFEATAIVRLELFSGVPFSEIERLRLACGWSAPWADVVQHAMFEMLDAALFERLSPGQQNDVMFNGLSRLMALWGTPELPLVELAQRYLADYRGEESFALRMVLCEHLLWSGQLEGLDAVLAPMREASSPFPFWRAMAEAGGAALLALQGRWAQAEAAYDAVFAALKTETKARKGLLPVMLAAPYALSLLAQQTPAHLRKALKYCLAEGGKRTPAPNHWSGIVALAIQMRLGDERLDTHHFRPVSNEQYLDRLDPWRWLMAAWLKQGHQAQPVSKRDQASLALLRKQIAAAGLPVLVAQIDAAVQVLAGEPAPESFFVPPPQEAWRVALAALMSVAAPEAAVVADTGGDTRLLWQLRVFPSGEVDDVAPLEQKRGPRGWGKPKPLSLSKLAKADNLLPADVAVARTVRQGLYERDLRLDLAAAVTALIGHPHVEFEDAPGLSVTLVEASPEIDVVTLGGEQRVRMLPALHPRPERLTYQTPSAAEVKEIEALQALSVLRDSPQRARVIRLTPAHRRVAQLLGQGLVVPADGAAQLQQVLQGLGAHFQVHADEVQAAREVEPDARLRAELAPRGDGVSLRLVVAPLGVDGPRLTPGSGRARLVAALAGETVGAQRDLAQERAHLDAVLDACPQLEPQAGAEWLIDGADEALAVIEQLHTLAAAGLAIAALDWPAGKTVRVDTAALPQLQVNVRSATDWLALQGGVQVDERLLFSLQQMLDWSRTGTGRFIPLGEGRYLALTQELRTRLDELAAVVDVQRGEARVPVVAAAWLDAVMDGAQLQGDAGFARRIESLAAGQQAAVALPAGLQAQLRPYQEEGYQWAMRLAKAGLGACLADDMGLGKTLQALAVLLARAAGGPALLLAPTSLMGNWLAEARRFAPSLQMHLFSESDRDSLVAGLGPQDVVLVSYQMHQQNLVLFAAREWHTLVLDEAQAIKNAAAKRAQAAHEMRADFRLALSGTPIENRLSELWSVMRVCNPGLLGSLARFNERFAGPIERDRNRQAQRSLRRLIAPFVLRRTKAQVLDDLPPRTELTLTVEPDAAERAHYEALRRQALEAAEQSLAGDSAGHAQMNILAQLTRLRRAACDPRLVSPQLGLVGAKVQAFSELAAELSANGHKALVFSQFVDFLSLLREPLDAAGIAYQYLDGATPTAERTRRVAAFQAGEGDLFLISLKAGGFGLNLTMADYVVIADPWWNPAAEDQASGRAHRIGQQRPVTVYRLVNRGTLEERIVALHSAKRELADSVLEGGDVKGALKAEELVALIQGD